MLPSPRRGLQRIAAGADQGETTRGPVGFPVDGGGAGVGGGCRADRVNGVPGQEAFAVRAPLPPGTRSTCLGLVGQFLQRPAPPAHHPPHHSSLTGTLAGRHRARSTHRSVVGVGGRGERPAGSRGAGLVGTALGRRDQRRGQHGLHRPGHRRSRAADPGPSQECRARPGPGGPQHRGADCPAATGCHDPVRGPHLPGRGPRADRSSLETRHPVR